jgi:hypothetical protein
VRFRNGSIIWPTTKPAAMNVTVAVQLILVRYVPVNLNTFLYFKTWFITVTSLKALMLLFCGGIVLSFHVNLLSGFQSEIGSVMNIYLLQNV